MKLNLGAMSDPIGQQLKEQGYEVTQKDSDVWQDSSVSIIKLRISGLLTDSESRKAEQRLFNKIAQKLKKNIEEQSK